jgi:hypothetical protein
MYTCCHPATVGSAQTGLAVAAARSYCPPQRRYVALIGKRRDGRRLVRSRDLRAMGADSGLCGFTLALVAGFC